MNEKSYFNQLGERFKRGDKLAFDQLFYGCFERLRFYALKILQDDLAAQDVVQNAFVKLWENQKEISNVDLEAFLFKLVRNGCIDQIRKWQLVDKHNVELKQIAHMEELYRIDFCKNEPLELIEEELHDRFTAVLNTLPPRCREIFIYSRVDGLKNREIAEKLNINIKNVEKQISKALKVFKKYFGNELLMCCVVLFASK
ncbi:RNA polymerase sigma-70 factor [Prolixibacteraceae bacterium JC049]|nr:RNA polymerase sigma-70 factor [Prolixibacteraceae bacterium JC049]